MPELGPKGQCLTGTSWGLLTIWGRRVNLKTIVLGNNLKEARK